MFVRKFNLKSRKVVEAKKEDVLRAYHFVFDENAYTRAAGRSAMAQLAKDARRTVRGLLVRMGLDPVLYEEGYEGVVRREREAREMEQEAREKAYRVPRSPEHAGEIYRLAVSGFTHGGRAAARERINVWAKEAGSEEVGPFLAQYGLDHGQYQAVQRSDSGWLIAA